MPIKTFTPSVLTSADMNTYLMQQSVIICTSGTRPGSPVNGMTIYETDTACQARWNGSAWVYDVGGVWQSYTPTLSNITLGNGTLAARWARVGKTITGNIRFVAGGTTSYSAGNLALSVPVAPAAWISALDVIGSGWIDNGSGATRRGTTIQLASSGSSNMQHLYEGGTVMNNAPFTFTTTSRISMQFMYEGV